MINYARQNAGLVNTDKSAFVAAKRRRERDNSIDKEFARLNNKINNLEHCVQRLEDQIREMNQK